MIARKNPMYGNEHGLPGLPKTTYLTVGGRRVQTQAPRTRPTPLPPAPLPPKTTRPLPTPRPIIMPSGPDPTLSRRIDSLDLRINSTEQSNRTLLDELMRLQQDIKGGVRKNEMEIQQERDARTRMETGLRQTQSKTQEYDDRIRRCEDGIRDNRSSIQQLSSHVQNIENLVQSLRMELNERKGDTNGSRNSASQSEVARLASEIEQLNRMLNNMRDEAKNSGRRVDGMQNEIGSLQSAVKLHARLMDEQGNQPPPKTGGVDKNIFDNDRVNTEAKLRQLNKTINDLQTRLSSEAENRQKIEQDFNNKLNSLLRDNSAARSKYDQKQKDYDAKMKELQLGFSDTDKKQIKMEMSNIANSLDRKIIANDAKIREDTVDKLEILEKTLKAENEKRATKEKELEGKVEKGMKEMKEKGEVDSANLKTELDKRVKENKDKLSSLNNRMNDVEKAVRDQKLEHEKLLEAEITERLNSDKVLDAKIDDLEDDIQLGFKTLQDEIGQQKTALKKTSKDSKGKTTTAPLPPSVDLDEIEALQNKNADGIRAHVASETGKLDKRVAKLETELKQRDENIKNSLATAKAEDKEANTLLGGEMQQQIDAVVFKHNKLKKKVDDMERDTSSTPQGLLTFKDETNASMEQLRKQVTKEEKERKTDVSNLKENIDRIVGSENQAEVPSLTQLNIDVDQTQTGLKKCAESIHVVKTMLNDKVKDERKIREKQCSILETDVERLDTKIKELKERIKNNGTGDDLDDLDDFM